VPDFITYTVAVTTMVGEEGWHYPDTSTCFSIPTCSEPVKCCTEWRNISWHNLWFSLNFIWLVNYIQRSEIFAVSAGDSADKDTQRLGTG